VAAGAVVGFLYGHLFDVVRVVVVLEACCLALQVGGRCLGPRSVGPDRVAGIFGKNAIAGNSDLPQF
jgi:hypothetical protein